MNVCAVCEFWVYYGIYMKHFGNNAGEMPVVVYKSLGSDKDLDYNYHVVVLHPKCRCSFFFCESFESFFKFLQVSDQTENRFFKEKMF